MSGILEKIEKFQTELWLTESKTVDDIYKALMKIPVFKNLSMDRQGEISMEVEKMIKK